LSAAWSNEKRNIKVRVRRGLMPQFDRCPYVRAADLDGSPGNLSSGKEASPEPQLIELQSLVAALELFPTDEGFG
jgi:hypothetical protein